MDEKQRKIKLRLYWFKHFQEKSHNAAKTCRYFGISRYTYYFWLKRYQKSGINGLYDQSRRPKTSPKSTPQAVIRKIKRLRKKYRLGPVSIARLLLEKKGFKISPKTVYLILKKSGFTAKIKK